MLECRYKYKQMIQATNFTQKLLVGPNNSNLINIYLC